MKIEVTYKSKGYNVMPYHEVPKALRSSYEAEEDMLLKDLALARVFESILTDAVDFYDFDKLNNHDQAMVAALWLKKSKEIENIEEEPNVVY